MKPSLYIHNKTLIALAVAVAAVAGSIGQAQDQPTAPPANQPALPPEIEPNTPLAQVIKLVQAGVDLSLINNFIATEQSPFNLDADKIMDLADLGVPKAVINAMLDRDKALYLAANMTPPAETAPPAAPAAPDTTSDATSDTVPDTAPAPVTVDYFDNTLSPYGTWVDVDGYGRCWRPTTVIYDSGWRPYCDRGHWVYTDCGWYWDSDYSWGVTFHYGRWFRDTRFGWCWYPDTAWAPSWVTWRSANDYCGWAPLPPFAVYSPGVGFLYRGAGVAVDFDFGLGVDCFTFVTPDHFLENHPRRFCLDAQHAPQVFGRTSVINNFNSHDRFVVNNGIPVERVGALAHHPIPTVQVGSLPNAGREGWRGPVTAHPVQRVTPGNNNYNPNSFNPARNSAGGNGQTYRTTAVNENGSYNPNRPNYNASTQPQAGIRQTGNTYAAPRPINTETPGEHTVITPEPRQQETQPYGAASQTQAGIRQTGSTYAAPRPINTETPGERTIITPEPRQQETQPRYTAPVEPERSTPPVEQRPVEERQYSEPSRPAEPEQPSHVETVQHSAPPAAAPAQNEQHSEDHSSDKNQNGNQNGH